MTYADRPRQSPADIDRMMASVSEALNEALSDVDHARVLLEQERQNPEQRSRIESKLRRVLQAIEGNLTNTSIGFRMFVGVDETEADST